MTLAEHLLSGTHPPNQDILLSPLNANTPQIIFLQQLSPCSYWFNTSYSVFGLSKQDVSLRVEQSIKKTRVSAKQALC